MPNSPTKPVAPLSENELAEIEAVNKQYRVDWRYPNQRERVNTLCQSLRAAWTERLEIQRALASSVLNDPTEDDDKPYSTTELVQGIGWIIRMKEAAQQRNAALREQLAQRTIELQVVNGDACKEEQDAGNGPCGICRTCLQSRLARVEKERERLRVQVQQLRDEIDGIRAAYNA